MVLGDLAEFTHFVTRVKVVPAVADDVSLTEAERTRGRAFAAKLSMRVLARTWQMLLKGIAEVEAAGRPIAAAEMVLVRIAYAADLPTPDEVIRSLGDTRTRQRHWRRTFGANVARGHAGALGDAARRWRHAWPARLGRAVAGTGRPRRRGECAGARAQRFEDLIALAAEKRDVSLKSALERDVRLVRFEDGQLEIALEPSAAKMLVGDLSKKLHDWTGRRWMVVVSAEPGAPSLRSQAEERKTQLKSDARSDPLVQAVLTRFPRRRNRRSAPAGRQCRGRAGHARQRERPRCLIFSA